jgi:hypothetical protein
MHCGLTVCKVFQEQNPCEWCEFTVQRDSCGYNIMNCIPLGGGKKKLFVENNQNNTSVMFFAVVLYC